MPNVNRRSGRNWPLQPFLLILQRPLSFRKRKMRQEQKWAAKKASMGEAPPPPPLTPPQPSVMAVGHHTPRSDPKGLFERVTVRLREGPYDPSDRTRWTPAGLAIAVKIVSWRAQLNPPEVSTFHQQLQSRSGKRFSKDLTARLKF